MSRTIVMIHGMFCGSWCWDGYRRFFEDRGYRCIVPTLRYHDVDPKDKPHPNLGTVSLLDYTHDIEKEIHGLGEKPILMGHSMGGLISQILGSRGVAASLVLLSPAAPSGIFAIRPPVIKGASVAMIEWGFWRKPIKSTFESSSYSALHLLPEPQKKEVFGRYVWDSGRAFFELGFWFFDTRKASAVDEASIHVPMLIVSGAEDRITPASVHRRIARKYGKVATYMEFPNHAHWIFGEPGWERIAEQIHLWLNQNETGTGNDKRQP